MRNLYIVGNGFDLSHNMPTKYVDFLHYLYNKYVNEIDKYTFEDSIGEIIPSIEVPLLDDRYLFEMRSKERDVEESVKWFLKVVNQSESESYWNSLEESLGKINYYNIIERQEMDFPLIQMIPEPNDEEELSSNGCLVEDDNMVLSLPVLSGNDGISFIHTDDFVRALFQENPNIDVEDFNIDQGELDVIEKNAPEIRDDEEIVEFLDPMELMMETQYQSMKSWVSYASKIQTMFLSEWIDSIAINEVKSKDVLRINSNRGDNYFLTFNYTMVLEEVYKISSGKILHIHGKKGDEKLHFGSGMLDQFEGQIDQKYKNSGIQDIIDITRKNFVKELQIDILVKFLKDNHIIEDIDAVYCLGFSFGDVDIPYIKKIHELCPNVKWIINDFASDYSVYKEKLIDIGIDSKFIQSQKLL